MSITYTNLPEFRTAHPEYIAIPLTEPLEVSDELKRDVGIKHELYYQISTYFNQRDLGCNNKEIESAASKITQQTRRGKEGSPITISVSYRVPCDGRRKTETIRETWSIVTEYTNEDKSTFVCKLLDKDNVVVHQIELSRLIQYFVDDEKIIKLMKFFGNCIYGYLWSRRDEYTELFDYNKLITTAKNGLRNMAMSIESGRKHGMRQIKPTDLPFTLMISADAVENEYLNVDVGCTLFIKYDNTLRWESVGVYNTTGVGVEGFVNGINQALVKLVRTKELDINTGEGLRRELPKVMAASGMMSAIAPKWFHRVSRDTVYSMECTSGYNPKITLVKQPINEIQPFTLEQLQTHYDIWLNKKTELLAYDVFRELKDVVCSKLMKGLDAFCAGKVPFGVEEGVFTIRYDHYYGEMEKQPHMAFIVQLQPTEEGTYQWHLVIARLIAGRHDVINMIRSYRADLADKS